MDPTTHEGLSGPPADRGDGTGGSGPPIQIFGNVNISPPTANV